MWGPYLEWLRLNDQMPMQEKVQPLLTGSLHAGEALWHVDPYQEDLEMTRLPGAMFDTRIIHFVRSSRRALSFGTEANKELAKVILSRQCLWQLQRSLDLLGGAVLAAGLGGEDALHDAQDKTLFEDYFGADETA